MKPKLTLVYDGTCPNVGEARAALRAALTSAGLEPRWTELDRAAQGVPERLGRYGSPTILIDGVDVAGATGDADASCCRVYETGSGLRGVPPVETILAAIEGHRDPAKTQEGE